MSSNITKYLNQIKQMLETQLPTWGVGHVAGPLFAKIEEIITTELQGDNPIEKELMATKIQLRVKTEECDRLRQDTAELKSVEKLDKVQLTKNLGLIQTELEATKTRLSDYTSKMRTREEEVNRLYNLTESDPKYRIYYIVRDAAPEWIAYEDIYKYTPLPSKQVNKQLELFHLRGLIQLENKRARAHLVIRNTSNQ
ncbi:MAG: hypothetical protein ACW976_07020 [Candidatus Ranarchaeia archaeon]